MIYNDQALRDAINNNNKVAGGETLNPLRLLSVTVFKEKEVYQEDDEANEIIASTLDNYFDYDTHYVLNVTVCGGLSDIRIETVRAIEEALAYREFYEERQYSSYANFVCPVQLDGKKHTITELLFDCKHKRNTDE